MEFSFLVQQDLELATHADRTEVGGEPLAIRDVVAVTRWTVESFDCG